MSTDVISYAERRDIFDRLRTLEQDLKLDRARLDGQSNTIQAIVREVSNLAVRMNAAFPHIRELRTDPITQPLPASPAPVEPAPAPETPEQTATRLLGDPEALVVVLMALSLRLTEDGRSRMRERFSQICALGTPVRSHSLRVFAAAIAAGSFA